MWHFWTTDNRNFLVTDENNNYFTITSHCLACAKIEVLSKYGGKVDGRGHKDICGVFLKAMQQVIKEELSAK